MPPTLLGFYLHPLRLALLNENRHCDYRRHCSCGRGRVHSVSLQCSAWSGRHGVPDEPLNWRDPALRRRDEEVPISSKRATAKNQNTPLAVENRPVRRTVLSYRFYSAGASRSRSTPMRRGKRLSAAARTRSGARKARRRASLPFRSCQPFAELRPPPPSRDAAHCDRDGFLLADQHDQLLAARDAGVEEVPLQHGVVLGHHRDDDGGVLRALAFVNRRSIGRHQRVECAKAVSNGTAVKAGRKLARLRVYIVDVADVAVINLLVVIVLDLHDLVAGCEGPAEAFDLALAGGV